MIYTSGNNIPEAMVLIGSKPQIKSPNVDDFILIYDDTPLELVEYAKYLNL